MEEERAIYLLHRVRDSVMEVIDFVTEVINVVFDGLVFAAIIFALVMFVLWLGAK